MVTVIHKAPQSSLRRPRWPLECFYIKLFWQLCKQPPSCHGSSCTTARRLNGRTALRDGALTAPRCYSPPSLFMCLSQGPFPAPTWSLSLHHRHMLYVLYVRNALLPSTWRKAKHILNVKRIHTCFFFHFNAQVENVQVRI